MLVRSMMSTGLCIVLGGALLFGGCAKKVPPVEVSEASSQGTTMSDPRLSEDEAARRAREAAIAERERSVVEESMRRRFAEQSRTGAGGMSQEDFLNQDVLFAFDSFTLSNEAKALLEKKATWLAENPQVKAQVEGHCDERGTTDYNLALGERRAHAAKQYLTALGINGARLSTISYGEEVPADPRHMEDAWARNRRAHFVIKSQ
jgi:peptidoglycan-associated lipoprotein